MKLVADKIRNQRGNSKKVNRGAWQFFFYCTDSVFDVRRAKRARLQIPDVELIVLLF